MISEISFFVNKLLGLDEAKITILHIMMRALIVYVGGIILLRINRQLIGIRTLFNIVINILIGSILANGITGNSPFLASICGAVSLMFINWLIELMIYHIPYAELIITGHTDNLVKNGTFNYKNMKKHLITHNELYEELRTSTHLKNLNDIEEANFEPTGQISFIKKK